MNAPNVIISLIALSMLIESESTSAPTLDRFASPYTAQYQYQHESNRQQVNRGGDPSRRRDARRDQSGKAASPIQARRIDGTTLIHCRGQDDPSDCVSRAKAHGARRS